MTCCTDDCCGPGSYCCQHANPHEHGENGEFITVACRYCGADCSNGRSFDGDGYACPACADARALIHQTPYDEMANAGSLADDFLNAYAGSVAEARKRECNHAWPMADEGVNPDAHCLKGCGATYELWGGTHR